MWAALSDVHRKPGGPALKRVGASESPPDLVRLGTFPDPPTESGACHLRWGGALEAASLVVWTRGVIATPYPPGNRDEERT